jgi:hypothetical protein
MECAWHCTFHLNFPLLFCLAVWRPWKINSRLALDTGNIQSKMRLHNPKELLSTFPAGPYPTARSLCQFLLPLATKRNHETTHISGHIISDTKNYIRIKQTSCDCEQRVFCMLLL